jgi:hypothetical protein
METKDKILEALLDVISIETCKRDKLAGIMKLRREFRGKLIELSKLEGVTLSSAPSTTPIRKIEDIEITFNGRVYNKVK